MAAMAWAQDATTPERPAKTNETVSSSDEGQGLPKWEFGLGASAFYLNDYPGSDQQHLRWLPIPFVIYRGDFLHSDSQGKIHGLLLNSTEIDVDASIDGSFPVDDSQNYARRGMPGLDWMGEFGPRILVHVFKHPLVNIDLSLPARWVFSTDLTRVDDRGFDFNPEIKLRHRALFDLNGAFTLFLGGLWGTSQLTRYFYDVPAQFAIAGRPQYSSSAGFMYDYFGLYFMHTAASNDRLHYFAGYIKYYLGDSSNRNSPLMKTVENESYYAGIILNIYRSDARETRRSLIIH